jgi:hypothetical protein
MKRFATVLVAVLTCLSADTQADERPSSVVRAFYKTKVALAPGGLPSKNELGVVSRFLSKDLVALFSRARVIEHQCALVTPADTKPPIWEGGVFAGNTEGATRLTSTKEKVVKGSATVTASLEYIDNRFPVGHQYRVGSWNIDVKLKRTGSRWVISDLIYDDGQTLRKELIAYQECDT